MTAAVQDPSMTVPNVPLRTLYVPIQGTAPLIVHRFSEKARKQMLDTMQGRKSPKLAKDPDAEYKSSLYHISAGGYGFPSVGFKAAIVGAARFYDKSVTMVGLRQMLFIDGDPDDTGQKMIRIMGSMPTMRQDVVRVGQGGTDLRYRAQFTNWTAVLPITYVASALTETSVISLVNAGGMGVGVGEWRPEKRGDFGTFKFDPTTPLKVADHE